MTVVVSTITGVTVVVSAFVTIIVVSTVPAAVSVFVTGSFEIGILVDERVFAGHFAVGFAPARQVLFVLSDVLCAIAADAMMTVNATATPVALRPLLRIFMFSSSIA